MAEAAESRDATLEAEVLREPLAEEPEWLTAAALTVGRLDCSPRLEALMPLQLYPRCESGLTQRISPEMPSLGSAPQLHDVREEIAKRSRFHRADFSTAVTHWSKTLAASLFMFFATLFSTVALGAHLQQATDNAIGLSEYLLMNSVAGVLHALFGAQPLLIIRPTGPITTIMHKLYTLASSMGVPFHQLLAATCIWVSLFLLFMGFFGASRHLQRLTPFTYEIFACFVCSIYVYDGVSDMYRRFTSDKLDNLGMSLLDLNLALVVLFLSIKLQTAREWRFFSAGVRAFIADYAVTIAIFVATACSYYFQIATTEILRIQLPSSFAPSLEGRAWYSGSLTSTSLHTWLVAAIVAVPISFFFFMDQGISSLLCQLPVLGLARGSYYHSSFVSLGLLNMFGGLFGCPFVTGSLPHSPQFVRALRLQGAADGMQVAESRVAPLLVYLLIGVPLLAPSLIKMVPEAAIDGVLIFVGYEVRGVCGAVRWAWCRCGWYGVGAAPLLL